MTPDLPPDLPRSIEEILLDLLDLIAVTDRQQPAHRYIPTDRIRDLIVSGLVET